MKLFIFSNPHGLFRSALFSFQVWRVSCDLSVSLSTWGYHLYDFKSLKSVEIWFMAQLWSVFMLVYILWMHEQSVYFVVARRSVLYVLIRSCWLTVLITYPCWFSVWLLFLSIAERNIEVFDHNCDFAYFSFWFYQSLLFIFWLLVAYTLGIAMLFLVKWQFHRCIVSVSGNFLGLKSTLFYTVSAIPAFFSFFLLYK